MEGARWESAIFECNSTYFNVNYVVKVSDFSEELIIATKDTLEKIDNNQFIVSFMIMQG